MNTRLLALIGILSFFSLQSFAQEEGLSPFFSNEGSEEEARIELPTWLIQEKFHIVSRLRVNLNDRSEESAVSGESTTRDELKFVGPNEWRLFRQFPFTGNFEEWLRTKKHTYAVKPSNEKILHEKPPSDEAWRAVVTVSYELARRWSLPHTNSRWARWFEKIQEVSEPLVNVEGDSMTINTSVDPETKVKKVQINASGILPQGSSQINLNLQWTMEFGENLNLDLKKSLVGGA